jgi:hypothetical protein
VVSVQNDGELANELMARLRPPGSLPAVSVTELLSPRPAFWKHVVGPLPIAPEREVLLEAGRRLHRILGLVYAAQGQLEVRVHGNGVQGRVDVLSDLPLEIKTSGYPPPSNDPIVERPDHVDQVGMYSALLGVDRARLVYLQTEKDEVRAIAAYDVTFQSPERIRGSMDARARALSGAWASKSARGLPRCPWYARGCEFRGAGVCDCTGEETVAESIVAGGTARSAARPDLAAALEADVRLRLSKGAPPTIRRFADLIYPRRAFFEAFAPAPPRGSPRPAGETDHYSRLVEAVDGGRVGEATRLPTLSDEPDEEVAGFRGIPVLVRTSRASRRLDPGTVVAASPQYALQLGFRCVATGSARGRLIMGYDRGPDSERVQVLEYRFDPPSIFSRVWRARSRSLEVARERGDATGLDACPSWMFDRCPYRDRCACGSPSGRSQR